MAVKVFNYGGGLDELSKAIPAAIQGYQDAEDRQLKRLALEARFRADSSKREREMAKALRESSEFLAKDEVPLTTRQAYAERFPGLLDRGLIAKRDQGKPGLLDPFRSESAQRATKAKLLKEEMAGPRQLKQAWSSDPTTKASKEISAAFGRIQEVGNDQTAAGDLALIFNYMKMLDPRSVVRESEFRSAEQAKAWLSETQNAGIPVPSSIVTAIQKAQPGKKGAFLLPQQREDFMGRASDLYGSQMQEQQRLNEAAMEEARLYGIDPRKVVSPKLFRPVEKIEQKKPWERFK